MTPPPRHSEAGTAGHQTPVPIGEQVPDVELPGAGEDGIELFSLDSSRTVQYTGHTADAEKQPTVDDLKEPLDWV